MDWCHPFDCWFSRNRRKYFGLFQERRDVEDQPPFERKNLFAAILARDLATESSFELVYIEQRLIGFARIPASKVKPLQPPFLVTKYVAPNQIAIGPADKVTRRTV